MDELQALTERITEFRDERDWKQFHNPKDMALSLLLEAAELAEHFQWKSPEEISEHLATRKNEVAHELADVCYWVLLMAHDFDIDLKQAVLSKLDVNAKKYPVESSRGRHTKYKTHGDPG